MYFALNFAMKILYNYSSSFVVIIVEFQTDSFVFAQRNLPTKLS